MKKLGPIAGWRTYGKAKELLSANGILLSFTQVNNPSEMFRDMVPYCLGIILLNDGRKIVAQIADASLSDLSIGMPVKAVFRKLYAQGSEGIINYGIKFVPA